MTLKKKLVLISLMLVLLTRVMYIFFNDDMNKEYATSYIPEMIGLEELPCENISTVFESDKKYLNSIDLLFSGIEENRTGGIVIKITQEEDLIYQTNISLENIENNEWKKIYINAELTEEEYAIDITASDNCVKVPNILIVRKNNSAPESRVTYKDGSEVDGQLAIQYGYLTIPTLTEKLVCILKWCMGIIALLLITFYFDTIKEIIIAAYVKISQYKWLDYFLILCEVGLGLVVMRLSKTDYERYTKVLFIIISFLSAYNLREKMQYVHEKVFRKKNIFWLCILYIYGAFALEGQNCLIYPLNARLNLYGAILFILAILWFVPIINMLLYILDRVIIYNNNSKDNGISNIKFAALSLIILLLPAAINLYANNPGISSPDTYSCMITNAHNLKGMVDWHPAFYCMILSLILGIWDSTYAVIIVQYVFWAYVIIELFLYLKKKGIKDIVLLCSILFIGLNPANYIHLNTIWKDIPYTISILWSVIILAKLLVDFDEYAKKKYIYVELVISLVGIFFYRKNGVVPFVLMTVAMGIVLRKNWKVWASLGITFLMIGLIKGPVYNHLEIQSTGQRGMYIGLGQDILGVYYAGGEISQNTLEMINIMTYYNNAEYNYNPIGSNQSYDLYVEPIKFIWNYLDTFIHNPILMARAVIIREDVVWDIFGREELAINCVNFIETQDGVEQWNDYYPARKQNWLTEPMAEFNDGVVRNEILGTIVWRGGVSTLLGLVAIVYLLCQKGIKGKYLITIPVVGHFMSLLLSTGWSDFRYFWPMNIMFFAIVLLTMVVCKKNNEG